jgi:hypothetical protein
MRRTSGAIGGTGAASRTDATERARTAARRLGSLLVALLLVFAPGPAATPALASCAPPRPVEESLRMADAVLVGTVTHLENGGRWAVVQVEERWRGSETMPDTIEVRGGPEPGTSTSADRVFTGERYLFFLTKGPGYFADNACTATTVWTDDLAAFRPSGVAPAPGTAASPPMGPLDLAVVLPLAALIGALVIALVSYLLILRSRGRPPDWMR